MSILGSSIPSIGSSLNRQLLELIFKRNAILLNDPSALMSTGSSMIDGALDAVGSVVGLPLLGFVYETPEVAELLKFSYSEYPYLNRMQIVNSYMAENTQFRVKAYKALTPNTSVLINYTTNELIYSQLKKYCTNGGTFTLTTLWGAYTNLVLESLNGIAIEGQLGGIGFEFNFKKVGFTMASGNMVSDAISKLSGGFL